MPSRNPCWCERCTALNPKGASPWIRGDLDPSRAGGVLVVGSRATAPSDGGVMPPGFVAVRSALLLALSNGPATHVVSSFQSGTWGRRRQPVVSGGARPQRSEAQPQDRWWFPSVLHPFSPFAAALPRQAWAKIHRDVPDTVVRGVCSIRTVWARSAIIHLRWIHPRNRGLSPGRRGQQASSNWGKLIHSLVRAAK